MSRSHSYEAAKTRVAIYVTAGLFATGLSIGSEGLGVAGIILLVLGFWEHGNARMARARNGEKAREFKPDNQIATEAAQVSNSPR
jgi:hypothetical protein